MTMESDPVCGMDVDPAKAPARSMFEGRTYYFCSKSCKMLFDDEPERFIRGREDKARART
ncbi:MAG TPA: YHS domain-containing protein [Pyrinomonadaceae bacterium]|nr:YHS domain-containing protein [Pyrinomonadaceae bacterium]